MTTKFDVGQSVFIKGKVVDIKITKNTVIYTVEYCGNTGMYSASYKEKQLVGLTEEVGITEESDGTKT